MTLFSTLIYTACTVAGIVLEYCFTDINVDTKSTSQADTASTLDEGEKNTTSKKRKVTRGILAMLGNAFLIVGVLGLWPDDMLHIEDETLRSAVSIVCCVAILVVVDAIIIWLKLRKQKKDR